MRTAADYFLTIVWLFLLTATSCGADDGPILWPVKPAEAKDPTPVDTLNADEWLVVERSVKIFVRSFPEGMINVEETSGPIRVRGKFADGNGKIETREYRSPYIYFLTAAQSGRVGVDLVPAGLAAETDIARHVLTVSDGTKPNPPPPPAPGPEPVPPGPEPQPEPPPQPVKSFRVIFVKESGSTLPVAQSSIPGAREIRDYLNVRTTQAGGSSGWREYDPQQITINEQLSMVALWQAVKPKLLSAPCLVIEVNGKATVMPFPANVAECVATLKKYGGE